MEQERLRHHLIGKAIFDTLGTERYSPVALNMVCSRFVQLIYGLDSSAEDLARLRGNDIITPADLKDLPTMNSPAGGRHTSSGVRLSIGSSMISGAVSAMLTLPLWAIPLWAIPIPVAVALLGATVLLGGRKGKLTGC